MKGYLDTMVGVYKYTGTGFFRRASLTLREFLVSKVDIPSINVYRESINSTTPKGNREFKYRVKAFSPAGDYGQKRRVVSELPDKITGLVHLDFDGVKLPKNLFKKHKFIAVAQPSVSGNGFFLLINTPGYESDQEYGERWQAACDFFRDTANLMADPAVGSSNEIRFGGLPSELQYREDAEEFNERTIRVKSEYESLAVPHDGEVIGPDPGTTLRYADLCSLAGKNNANGVPIEKFKSCLTMDMFEGSTSITSREVLDRYIDRIYDTYREQHGEVVTPVISRNSDINLPTLKLKKDESQQVIALRVVKNILQHYLLRTSSVTGATFKFNDKNWEEIPPSDLRNFLSQCAMASGASPIMAELQSFRDLLMKQLQDLTSSLFETNKTAINMNNGVLTFSDGAVSFSDHDEAHNFIYCMPYDYNPDNHARPVWDGFIDWAVPDDSTQRTLYQYLASGFIGPEINFELTMILLGTGSNGKSTIVEMIRSLFGDAVGDFSIDSLTNPDGDRSAKQVRHIYNKVFGVSHEDGRIRDFTLWRKVVSRQAIPMKALYRDEVTTTNYGRLISCMNDVSYMDSHVDGSTRRVLLIPMKSKVLAENYDLELSNKIRSEAGAIINLIVQGYKELVVNRYHIEISATVKAHTQEVVDEFDNILQYLKSKEYRVVPEPLGNSNKLTYIEKLTHEGHGKVIMVKGVDLYADFQSWCHGEGLKPIAKRTMEKRLRIHGHEVRKIRVDNIMTTMWIFGVGDIKTYEESNKKVPF